MSFLLHHTAQMHSPKHGATKQTAEPTHASAPSGLCRDDDSIQLLLETAARTVQVPDSVVDAVLKELARSHVHSGKRLDRIH